MEKTIWRRPRVFESIKHYLADVEDDLRAEADAFDPAVEGYVTYVCNSSGKRLRPALSLLTAGALEGIDTRHVKLATILEFLHVASLVHDDIIDGADRRRGLPTASAKWGSGLSVLLGDSLFSHALELSTHYDDILVCRKIAQATKDVCTGEIIQTQRRFDLKLTIEDYLEIIRMKTAALFAAATEVSAILSGASSSLTDQLRDYGLYLGTAYQIYDDCVDLVGEESVIGKTLGTDLKKGKLTLPVLYLLQEATDLQKEKLSRMILQPQEITMDVLAGVADYEGALDRSVRLAKDLSEKARENLIGLSDNPFSGGLRDLTHYLDGLLDQCRPS